MKSGTALGRGEPMPPSPVSKQSKLSLVDLLRARNPVPIRINACTSIRYDATIPFLSRAGRVSLSGQQASHPGHGCIEPASAGLGNGRLAPQGKRLGSGGQGQENDGGEGDDGKSDAGTVHDKLSSPKHVIQGIWGSRP